MPKHILQVTEIQSGRERAWVKPDIRRHEVARPRLGISSQNHHIGRHHRCQENHAALGERERSQNQSRNLDVVDSWIRLRWWPTGSCSSVQSWKSMEIPRQFSGHWAHGGLRRQAAGEWTCAWFDDREERNIAKACCENGGSLYPRASSNSTSGTPWAVTLRHPLDPRGGPSGKPGPRRQQRQGDRAAIDLGLG